MRNMSTFGNTTDVYAIVHLVPYACQHITVDHICYYCLLAANQDNYVRGLFFKEKRKAWFKKQNPQQNISSGSVVRRDLIPALKG
jgi:hypothetical protein